MAFRPFTRGPALAQAKGEIWQMLKDNAIAIPQGGKWEPFPMWSPRIAANLSHLLNAFSWNAKDLHKLRELLEFVFEVGTQMPVDDGFGREIEGVKDE